jgi:hypothetical protein
MDLISVSFVQSADDVRFVRKTLDAAGGQRARGRGVGAGRGLVKGWLSCTEGSPRGCS